MIKDQTMISTAREIEPGQRNVLYLTGICIATTIGGFLFGYDTAVISGCIDFVEAQFSLNPELKGWVVSSVLLGCIVGSAASGTIADRFGRKPVLIVSSFLLLVSAIGSMVAMSVNQLVVFRLVGGLGVGITAMASPMYMSEIAPAYFRGRIVSFYQLAITAGIVCAFYINAVLLKYAGSHGTQENGGFWYWVAVAQVWRGMFGAETIPAVIYTVLLFLIPESPRWLLRQGHVDAARNILKRTDADMLTSVENGQYTVVENCASVFELFRPGLRKVLLIGIALPLFSQFSGINAVMYFGPSILKDVGFDMGGAMGGAILIGIVNFLFTGIAIWKVDASGRRPLLILGVSGCLVSLIAAAVMFAGSSIPNAFKLVPLLAYCACFSFSYGPVCWVIIGEIFPTRYRGRAVSIATAAIWLGAFIVSQSFPRMLTAVGAAGCFAVYAALTAVALVFIWFCIKETKGATLEEIEEWWGRSAGANRSRIDVRHQ